MTIRLQVVLYSICFLLFFASCYNDKKSMVVGKIRMASDLATTSFTIDKLVYGKKHKKLFWVVNLNESRFLGASRAYVKAGINLNEIGDSDVVIDDRTITLRLPHVRVISFSYPADQFKESPYSKDFTFNKISVVEKEELFRDAELDIRSSLKYMDIRKTTEDKTRVFFEALLRSMGYTTVFIEFKDGELISELKLNTVQ